MMKTLCTRIILFIIIGQCWCIDFQNNPFFQNVKLKNTEDLGLIYPNNPFFLALSKQINSDNIPTAISTSTTTIRTTAITKPDDLPPVMIRNSETCGRAFSVNKLIFNGYKTNEGDWPWLVALFFQKRRANDDSNLNFICGGNLLNKRYVMSAAHCVTKLNEELGQDNYEMYAYLGLYDLTKRNSPNVQKRKIDKMNVHPNYKPGDYSDSDISLLRLETQLEYTHFIRPICLWKWKPNLQYVVGSTGRVVGWGRDENTEGPTNEPQLIDLPIVSQKECRASHIAFHYFTSNATFCAGFRNNSGPCNGDSGSGLYLRMKDNEREKWFLRGIVSQSLKKDLRCDLDNYLIFTDVPHFYSWLSDFMKNEDL